MVWLKSGRRLTHLHGMCAGMKRPAFCQTVFGFTGTLLLVAGLTGCGSPSTPVPDAGPDTSCGLDCAAQKAYGLISGTCFEYSSTGSAQTPASLGALVLPAISIEGGLTVIPVEYRAGGQLKQKDSFMIVDGALKLARREYGAGGSVTYQDGQGNIVGAKWLELSPTAGQPFTSNVTAKLVPSNDAQSTTYRVVANASSTNDLTVPLKKYDTGFTLLINESPDHGADSRRVWVDQVGFVMFIAPFSVSGVGQTQEFRLQNVKTNVTGSCGT